jgi:nucleoid-associated protein YgaU
MPKDLKIGMILGLVVVIVAGLWMSARLSLSTKARMLGSNNASGNRFTAESAETAEGNQLPIIDSQSKLPDLTVYEQAEKINPVRNSTARYNMIQKGKISPPGVPRTNGVKTQRFHIVRKGENLSEISYTYYGSANKWQKILDANRKVIKDANTLRPGVKLIIPELKTPQ